MDIYKQKWTIVTQRLFSLLCARAGERLSQRELAIELLLSPTAIGTAANRLERGGLITRERTKTGNFLSLRREQAIPLKRVENLRSITLFGLSDYLEEAFPGSTIILFGSYARGEDVMGSDIDIAVIGRKEKPLELSSYEKNLLRPINVNFYPDWKHINKELRNNILNGIVLCGSVNL